MKGPGLGTLSRDTARLPFLKRGFPFRLSTTSCIIPESILANLRLLGPHLDEVELVLFETGTENNLPAFQDIRDMNRAAKDMDITCNVHLPGDLFFGDPDPALRQRFRDTAMRFYERTLPLDPTLFILHLDSRRADGVPESDSGAWTDRVTESLSALVQSGLDPGHVAVENLEYPLDRLVPFVDHIGLQTCLDIGHLIRYGHELHDQLEKHLPRCAMIHLHGVQNGVDHLGLQWISPENWQMICRGLTDFAGGLSLEIFSMADLEASLDRLQEISLSG